MFKLFDFLKGYWAASDDVVYDFEYVTLEDCKKELKSIDEELSDLEETVKYYNARRKSLLDWRHELEVHIGKLGEADICCNCKFYSDTIKLYCNLYACSVNEDATCSSFEWGEGTIKEKKYN